MASQAILGQGSDTQRITRHAGRIERLQAALAKAEARGNAEKAEAIRAEMRERSEALEEVSKALEAAKAALSGV